MGWAPRGLLRVSARPSRTPQAVLCSWATGRYVPTQLPQGLARKVILEPLPPHGAWRSSPTRLFSNTAHDRSAGDAASPGAPTEGTPKRRRASTKRASAVDALAYERKTPVEHVLLRPDMYVGSTKPETASRWIYNPKSGRMQRKELTVVPALVKIFDEILVNAADNYQRDAKTDRIDVTIDRGSNRISVLNTGRALPIEVHPTEGVYVGELVFGTLLTGSNFNDEHGRITGGRHGFGAKLLATRSSGGYSRRVHAQQQRHLA